MMASKDDCYLNFLGILQGLEQSSRLYLISSASLSLSLSIFVSWQFLANEIDMSRFEGVFKGCTFFCAMCNQSSEETACGNTRQVRCWKIQRAVRRTNKQRMHSIQYSLEEFTPIYSEILSNPQGPQR